MNRQIQRRNQNLQTVQRLPPVRGVVRGLARQVNQSRVVRLGARRQLLSVPQHNYSLKVQRVFRIAFVVAPAGLNTVDLTLIKDSVRGELGVGAPGPTISESFAIHEVRLYATSTPGVAVTTSNVQIDVNDIEEAGGGTANVIDSFNDFSSVSGIAHIHFRFPVNNRPTFTGATPDTPIFVVRNNAAIGSAAIVAVMDLVMDYTRLDTSYLSTLAVNFEQPSLTTQGPGEDPAGSCESGMGFPGLG